MTGFYYFTLKLPLFCLGVLADHHRSVSYSVSTTCLCWPCHSPSPDKEDYFIFFVCCGTLTCYGVSALYLFIPHGMHLVVPTHSYFFWVVCHPSRTFPPKEPKQESQNRFSPLSTARPYPLTSDP